MNIVFSKKFVLSFNDYECFIMFFKQFLFYVLINYKTDIFFTVIRAVLIFILSIIINY